MELIARDETVAIVGIAKNCGKTTTLNALLAHHRELPIGLCSIGIDGEPEDMLIGTPKPKIHVTEGQWVISAQDALDVSTARVEYVASLDIETPMGQVFLVQVREPGDVMLAGLRHREDLRRALHELEVVDAGPILIDGAYGRVIAAHTSISDAIIVSTGAIVSPVIAEIVTVTAALTDRLTLPHVERGWQRALLADAITQDRALLGGPEVEPEPLPARSALIGLGRARDQWRPKHQAVAIPGLVSDRVVEELLAVPAAEQRRALLVPDGTVLQANQRLMHRLKARWDVRVALSATLRAVAFNPTSVAGPGVDAAALRAALREEYHDAIAVFDPQIDDLAAL